jgi:hypothetical protein
MLRKRSVGGPDAFGKAKRLVLSYLSPSRQRDGLVQDAMVWKGWLMSCSRAFVDASLAAICRGFAGVPFYRSYCRLGGSRVLVSWIRRAVHVDYRVTGLDAVCFSGWLGSLGVGQKKTLATCGLPDA